MMQDSSGFGHARSRDHDERSAEIVQRFGFVDVLNIAKLPKTEWILTARGEGICFRIKRLLVRSEDRRGLYRKRAVDENRNRRDAFFVYELMQQQNQLLSSPKRKRGHNNLAAAFRR